MRFVSDPALRLTKRGALIFTTAMSCASGCVSSTVTKKLQMFVLPALSVAVQTTGVAPTGNNEPDAGRHATVGVPQLSVATGRSNATSVSTAPNAAVAKTSGGQVISGGMDSVTVTVKEQMLVPLTLLAVQLTTVVPIENK